jgi:group I intron endonuclease
MAPNSKYDLSRGGIYNIINIHNGKHYLGSAVKLRKRWSTHRSRLNAGLHPNRHLQHAWHKYGEEAFEFAVIEYVDSPPQLIHIEQLYLDACWPSGNLYNVLSTAGSALGRKRSTETRRKMSATHTGHQISQETRTKLSIANTGKPPWNKGLSSWNKGKTASAATRLVMSASHSQQWLITHPDGRQELVLGLVEFCRAYSISKQSLWKRGASKGYVAVTI